MHCLMKLMPSRQKFAGLSKAHCLYDTSWPLNTVSGPQLRYTTCKSKEYLYALLIIIKSAKCSVPKANLFHSFKRIEQCVDEITFSCMLNTTALN